MGLLQPRAASVPRSTYVATTVLLVLWIITSGAIIVYLVRRLRKVASRFERPVTIDRSASYGNTAPHVPPDPIRRTEDLSRRTPTASPIRNLPAAPSSTAARQQTLLARQPSQAAMFARLQAMPLPSDTTDMSNETADTPRETVNASYMAMLAQRGIDARNHALVGSDDSTDAGAGGGMSYALRARGLVVGGLSAGMQMEPARFLGRGGHGRAMTYG